MSDEIRQSRPMHQGGMQQPSRGPEMNYEEEEPKGSKMPWIILGVVVVIIVLLGAVFRDKLFKGKMVSGSGYQAVFLTNGQVYFGKIDDLKSNYVTLKDIYYLQVIQQPPIQGTPQSGQSADQQQRISLVKLGNELHGPVDEMHISKAQILFYEDLKKDGSVVKAIDSYKANPSGTPAPAQQAPNNQIPPVK